MTILRRTVILSGVIIGMTWSAIPACIIPDYCIEIQYPGRNWCRALENAKMWPNGQPEAAMPIKDELGGAPLGCLCFNDADQNILADETPIQQFNYLGDLVTDAARVECSSLVPAGFDDNCYDDEGPDASIPLILLPADSTHDCIGSCEHINPPPNGECEDKNPYECNDSGYGFTSANDEVESGSDGDTDTGTSSETGIIQSPGEFEPG